MNVVFLLLQEKSRRVKATGLKTLSYFLINLFPFLFLWGWRGRGKGVLFCLQKRQLKILQTKLFHLHFSFSNYYPRATHSLSRNSFSGLISNREYIEISESFTLMS